MSNKAILNGLSFDIVLNNLDKEWDCFEVSRNKTVTMEVIKNNIDMPWDWNGVSENPNITINDILNNLDKPWNLTFISRNPQLTIKMINELRSNNFISICYGYNISSNLNVNVKDILNINDCPLNWDKISNRDDLTLNIVLDNLDKNWNWSFLSDNNFDFDRNNYIKRNFKKLLLTKLLLNNK